MITFAEKRGEFLEIMRAKMAQDNGESPSRNDIVQGSDADSDLTYLLEKNLMRYLVQ